MIECHRRCARSKTPFCLVFRPIFFLLCQTIYERRRGFTDLGTRSCEEGPIGLPCEGVLPYRELPCQGVPVYNINTPRQRQMTTCLCTYLVKWRPVSLKKSPKFKKSTILPRTDNMLHEDATQPPYSLRPRSVLARCACSPTSWVWG